jgi:hypothetical protein
MHLPPGLTQISAVRGPGRADASVVAIEMMKSVVIYFIMNVIQQRLQIADYGELAVFGGLVYRDNYMFQRICHPDWPLSYIAQPV